MNWIFVERFHWMVGTFGKSWVPFPFKMAKQKQKAPKLGGGFKYFLFSSLFGEMIQVD